MADWPAKRYADMGAATVADESAGQSFDNVVTRLQATTVVVTPGVLYLVTGVVPSISLPPAIVAPLRQLMAAVVTSGTAATAGLPTGTAGKTGTAEYGTATPLATHAWFTGFRGSLAFCAYAQDGSSDGAVAGPVAARFLKAVGS